MGLHCVIEFCVGNFEQKFLVDVTKLKEKKISLELVKFICYMSDYDMFKYFEDQIKAKQFTFEESFFIDELKKSYIVKEIQSIDDVRYKYKYTIDFEHRILYYYENMSLQKCFMYPFELLSDFPNDINQEMI